MYDYSKISLRKVFERFENDNIGLGYIYRKKNLMTPELEKDFDQFCQVMRNVFEEAPGKFSFSKVYKMIPGNRWIQKHRNFILLLAKSISEKTPGSELN